MSTLSQLGRGGTKVPDAGRIIYGFGSTSAGTVLVALGNGSVTALMAGDDPDAMERDLLYRYPGAVMCTRDDDLRSTLDRLKTLLGGRDAGSSQAMGLREAA